MKLFPKEDMKNTYDQILWYKDKEYSYSLYSDEYYVVTCELIGNEYPILTISEVKRNFYTLDEIRNSKVDIILK